MDITILCSNAEHPVVPWLETFVRSRLGKDECRVVNSTSDVGSGDFLFLVSCSEKVGAALRNRFRRTLVLHASDLPAGRGWSPHIWDLLGGADHITLSLIEAAEPIDSGRIWLQRRIGIPPDLLWDEINALLFANEIELMIEAVDGEFRIEPRAQDPERKPTYHRRRTPEDSRLDPSLPLRDLFNHIRLCDPDRFPAFFAMHGFRYTIKLEKMTDE